MMQLKVLSKVVGGVCLLWGALSLTQAATAANINSAVTGNYFKIPNSHPDNGSSFGVGVVEPTLGPDDLPVVAPTYRTSSGPIKDINSSGEILWWSTTSPYGVVAEKTQVDSLPIDHQYNFFPDGQTSNSPYFRAVHWSGTFDLASAGSVTFTLGSDDDSFLYIDNQLEVQNPGIHALSYVPNVISNISAGPHKVDLFMADRAPVQAGIFLNANVALSPISSGSPSSVPEPSEVIGILALGCIGLVSRFHRQSLHHKNAK